MRRRLPLLLAGVLGAAVAAMPAVAGSETSPTVEAENRGYYHYWVPAQVLVDAGGVVTLSNQSEVPHGVRWVSTPAAPTCTTGVPVASTAGASGTKWSGSCTFTAPGTYTFYCTVHGSEMTGTVTVKPTTTTTPSSSTQTGVAGPGAGSPGGYGEAGTQKLGGTGGAPGSPLAGSAASAIRIASHQHGGAVRGSVAVSEAGVGGRLQIELLARGAALARAGHQAQLRVGGYARSPLRAGPASFSVSLDARALRALHRRGRLALSVKVAISSRSGSPVTVARSVLMRG